MYVVLEHNGIIINPDTRAPHISPFTYKQVTLDSLTAFYLAFFKWHHFQIIKPKSIPVKVRCCDVFHKCTYRVSFVELLSIIVSEQITDSCPNPIAGYVKWNVISNINQILAYLLIILVTLLYFSIILCCSFNGGKGNSNVSQFPLLIIGVAVPVALSIIANRKYSDCRTM